MNIKNIYIYIALFIGATGLFACNGGGQDSHEGHDHGEVETVSHSDDDGHDHGDHAGHTHGEDDGHGTDDGHEHSDDDGHGHGEDDGHGHGAGGHDDHEEGLFLSQEQMKTIGLTFGDLTDLKINDFISTKGLLGVPPNAFSAVNPKAEGYIRNSRKFVEGEYLKKGSYIADIVNPAFIDKQSAYLQEKINIRYLEQELNRQKELLSANAGILKTVQKLESDLSSARTNLMGLGQHLDYLGIDKNSLSTDNITNAIKLYAGSSGYISHIDFFDGMFVSPNTEILRLMRSDHVHLELDVFERDIATLKIGQKITYTVPAISSEIYEGVIEVIGKEFSLENKTIRVHGHPEGKQPPFIKDMFVSAKIWLDDSTNKALPSDAIIRDGDNTFIFVATNDKSQSQVEFEQIAVIAGAESEGYTMVNLIDKVPKGKEIVTQGAYFVYAQSKTGELKHEH